MSSTHYDLTVKIYNDTALTNRTYQYVDFQNSLPRVYPDIIFPTGSNKKLIEVRANITFAPAGGGLMQSLTPSNTFEFRYVFWGYWLNVDGTPVRSGNADYLPAPDNILIFNVSQSRLLLDDANSSYKPGCLYVGGLRLENIAFYWRTTSNISGYYARMRLHFEFED